MFDLPMTFQVACSQGCGMEVPLDEMQNHNCIQQLRNMLMGHIYTLEGKLNMCEAEIERLKEVNNQTPIIANDQQRPGTSGFGGGQSSSTGPKPHNLSDEEIRYMSDPCI